MVLTWLHHPVSNSHINLLSVRYLSLIAYMLLTICPLAVHVLELEDYDRRCRCNRNSVDNMTITHESSVHNVRNNEIMKVLAILFYIVTGTSIFSFIAVLIAVVYSSCCKHPGRFRFADEEAVNPLDDTDDSGGSSPFGSGSRRGFQIPAGFCSSSPYQRLETRDWDEEEEASAARERMKHDPENVIYFRKDGNLDTSFVNPNYGRGSPLTIESHLSDNEEDPIRYYVSVYDELTASEMEEPSNSTSWQIPKLMKVATQPVSLRDPEYD
uniref:UL132B protein n=1 Tax=Human cytomegalovirus TaxID=10359 RepID=D6NSC8_HCMV|nr:UL132B protein [Human betaherpesvirus 5]